MTIPIPADSLRQVVRGVLSGAAYQWQGESDATSALRRWRRAVAAWLDDLASNHPVVFTLVLWAMVAVLVAIALHAVRVLIRATRSSPADAGRASAAGTAIVRTAAWFTALADQAFHEGRYAAAMQAHFMALTLELDTRNVLRFHPSKTPLEYLPEMPTDHDRRAAFAGLISELYRYAFAGEVCTAAAFSGWRDRARLDLYAPES